jgi:hypothetical protein
VIKQPGAATTLTALADRSFALVPAGLSTPEMSRRIGSSSYGIVTDASGCPLALVTPADLHQEFESFPMLPAVLCTPGLTLGEFANSAAVTLLDLVHGLVLRDGDEVTGVVPAEAVTAYLPHHQLQELRSSEWRLSATDSRLAGESVIKGHSVCRICGHLNIVDFYDKLRPPLCAGPDPADHVLEPEQTDIPQ